jgi:hypothetical protein
MVFTAQSDARGDVIGEAVEVLTHTLPEGLQGLGF